MWARGGGPIFQSVKCRPKSVRVVDYGNGFLLVKVSPTLTGLAPFDKSQGDESIGTYVIS